MPINPEKSPNWDERSSSNEPVGRTGYPYHEGFPRLYVSQSYLLIMEDGERVVAHVDDSRQYMAEGLEWRNVKTKESINKYWVVAWRQIVTGEKTSQTNA